MSYQVELWRKMRNGDRDAGYELYQELKYMVYRRVQNYQVYSDLDFDDLFEAAMFGLARAFATYDPNRGARLSSHAYNYINYELYAFNEAKRRNYGRRLNIECQELAVDPVSEIDDTEEQDHRFKKLMSALKRQFPNDVVLVQDVVINGMTFPEAGKKYNLSKQRIQQRVSRAIKYLRTVAEDNGYVDAVSGCC